MISPTRIIIHGAWRDLLEWLGYTVLGQLVTGIAYTLGREVVERGLERGAKARAWRFGDDAESVTSAYAAAVAPHLDWSATCRGCDWTHDGVGAPEAGMEHGNGCGHTVDVRVEGNTTVGEPPEEER